VGCSGPSELVAYVIGHTTRRDNGKAAKENTSKKKPKARLLEGRRMGDEGKGHNVLVSSLQKTIGEWCLSGGAVELKWICIVAKVETKSKGRRDRDSPGANITKYYYEMRKVL
jgi:hypothetical protein